MRNGFGFDLRSMEIFVETLEQGSQSAAARRLGLKQSSVSQSLANLEEALGVSLFRRHSRPLEPTSAGRFFHDRARRMLDEARSMRRELVSGGFGQLHQVRLALVDSLATAVGQPLLEMIKRYTRDYTLTTGLSHMHSHSLLTRHVDIIISDDRLENYDGLERHAVLREPFVLVVPTDWAGPLDNLRWLARQLDFVRYTPQSLIGQAIERHLRLNQLEFSARLHLDNTFAVLRLVGAGAGWTITTPLCLYQAGLDTLGVRVVPLPMPALYRELTLVARRDELGELPMQLARDSRRLLETDFRAALNQHLPWLSGAVETERRTAE
ncbi:LysR family transcriptional regulator [Halomonas urumqiensis]|uniref:LysR family transcriptional regulator n=1 Tax=Halomonas urumqiensis TaxID=1684789 RepID=A0A2N7UMF3_9GAMM|nr:LysR family transcriptional regulator [Halomonas urumqiensis]PMR81611.1 LysR family transcriptional regulator [Halomonas urumqiensis]PTB02248.1 LysR family transcriptional regulator [Halomonas urumqiensis]GHE21714.1 LysR family transcriptional regulator [Halomonas urumqiensis]